jgi:hypothetical protein
VEVEVQVQLAEQLQQAEVEVEVQVQQVQQVQQAEVERVG